MKLSVLLGALDGARLDGPDVEVAEIAYDSRRVHPGDLYLAVPSVGGSPESGGYQRIAEAVAAGAAAVLTQIPARPRPFLSSLCLTRASPWRMLPRRFFGIPHGRCVSSRLPAPTARPQRPSS